jgi:predicted RNase H-like HicB family nuclease
MQYVAVIEENPDGSSSAYVPELPVCFTVGDTLDEVKNNIKEAIALYIEEARRVGLSLPEPRTLALVEV